MSYVTRRMHAMMIDMQQQSAAWFKSLFVFAIMQLFHFPADINLVSAKMNLKKVSVKMKL